MAEGSGFGTRKTLAWLVHAYTALGLVLAAGIAVLVVEGTEEAFRLAFLLMGVAMVVDATDGWMARRVGVGEALPRVDGRRLDDIIDFHTYASLPLLLVWQAELLPGHLGWVLVIPLLASAYGFSRVDAKTEDGYFLGFPSYWNAVAFYLFFLAPDPGVSVAILLIFSALTLVPSLYLNLARPGPLTLPSSLLAGLWGLLVTGILLEVVEGTAWVLGSLFFPAYYLAASWIVSFRAGRVTSEGSSKVRVG